MLDFAALPPEINSARIYSGPGVAPMMAVASAWDTLAAQLELYAAGYHSVVSELEDHSWSGAASIAMASAAAPYIAWARTTAAQAERAASQARAAAAAYEAAVAATVPPEAVTTNRLLLATLVATNFFGQNTTMIAATQAAYVEMWAQDAAAMYTYAASSSAAIQLDQFSEPPQTTTAQLGPALPQQLQTGSAAGHSGSWSGLWPTVLLTAFGDINALTGPANFAAALSRAITSAGSFGTGLYRSDIQAGAKDVPGTRSATVRGPVLVSTARAATVGKLSVPQSWTAATAGTSPSDSPPQPPKAGLRVVPAGEPHAPPDMSHTLPGTGPMTGRTARRTSVPVLRTGRRRFTMPRPVFGG